MALTELTDGIGQQSAAPEGEPLDGRDPFNGDSQVLEWSGELNVGQLRTEMADALGDALQMAVWTPSASDPPGPSRVYVSPSSTDVAAVRRVLAAHKPDPYYGMSADDMTRIQLGQKARSDTPLTADEMQLAVKILFGG